MTAAKMPPVEVGRYTRIVGPYVAVSVVTYNRTISIGGTSYLVRMREAM